MCRYETIRCQPLFWTLYCLICTGHHDTEVFELASSTSRNILAGTAKHCTKVNYTIWKGARAFSHFKGDMLEELNQREVAFNMYELFRFEKEVHVHTASLRPVSVDDLILFPCDSQRYNPGCLKKHGNFVGENLEKMGLMEFLVSSSVKQSLSSLLLIHKFNLNSTHCSVTIKTECYPTRFSLLYKQKYFGKKSQK